MSLASRRMTPLVDIAVSHHAGQPVHVPFVSQSSFPVLLPMIKVADLYQCSGMDRITTLLSLYPPEARSSTAPTVPPTRSSL